MFDSVRTRLTLWYAGVLGLSLIAFALLAYYAAAAIFHQRQDELLRSTAQTVASAYVEELAEQHSIAKAGEVVLLELTFPNRYVEVIDNTGQPIAWSKNLSGKTFAIPSVTSGVVTVDGLRAAVVPLSADQNLGFAVVAEPLSVIDDGLRQLRRNFFAGVPLVLLLASAGGYFLARKSLAPIASMNSQTQQIGRAHV